MNTKLEYEVGIYRMKHRGLTGNYVRFKSSVNGNFVANQKMWSLWIYSCGHTFVHLRLMLILNCLKMPIWIYIDFNAIHNNLNKFFFSAKFESMKLNDVHTWYTYFINIYFLVFRPNPSLYYYFVANNSTILFFINNQIKTTFFFIKWKHIFAKNFPFQLPSFRLFVLFLCILLSSNNLNFKIIIRCIYAIFILTSRTLE